jgi:hypothetical protein
VTIAATLRAAYPNSNFLTTKDSLTIWGDMLKDLDFETCKVASKEYISSGKFPPSIADIRERCATYTQLPIKDYGEAWGSVLKAIRKYGYMEEEQALESMDETTRKCVKSLGFQNICHDEDEAAMRANFRMIYEQEANRVKKDNQLPIMIRSQKQQMIGLLIDNTVQQIEKKEEPLMDPKTADIENVGEMIKDLRRNLYGSTI